MAEMGFEPVLTCNLYLDPLNLYLQMSPENWECVNRKVQFPHSDQCLLQWTRADSSALCKG